MNPQRVLERGLNVLHQEPAWAPNLGLRFNKADARHAGEGHANLVYAPGEIAEGVLYTLASIDEINKMDRFERAPINYSREMLRVYRNPAPILSSEAKPIDPAQWLTHSLATWTYFANPAVIASGLNPSQSYLAHLLAGRAYLTSNYFSRLQQQATVPAQQ